MGGDSTASASGSAERKLQARSEVAPAVQRLVEAAILEPSQQLLCYGCGRGADVAWLKVRGYDAHGYDPYPPFGYSALPEGKYDRVLLVYLMSRLKTDATRRAAISKAFNYVRPGGHLIIASRNGHRLAQATGGATREDAAAYLEGLLVGCDTETVEVPQLGEEDGGLCVLARRAGIHQPATPWEWVDDPVRFAEVCAQLNHAPVVALDVETTLEEPRELCTVQLGVPGQTWIIDALAMKDLGPLKAVMENDAVEIIIHNAFFEEQMLGKHGIRITNVFDTLPASRKKHGAKVRGSHKLGDVCERELGIYLDKANQTSDWTRRPLDPDQLAYAAIDAEVLLDLYTVFKPPKEPEPLDLFPM